MNLKRVGISAAIMAALASAKAALNPWKKPDVLVKPTDWHGMPAKHNGGQKTGIAAARRAAKKRKAMKARSPK